MAVRLKKSDLSIKGIMSASRIYYKKKDNKPWRAKLDVKSAKITVRRNLTYNPSAHEWEQGKSREVKFVFLVKSDPISYKKTDTLKYHYYPVFFLLRDFDAGLDSAFRSRVGGFKRWKKSTKKISDGKSESEKKKIRKDNLRVLEQNIKEGLQGDFIFRQMWVWRLYDLLFGPLTCENRPPEITNKELYPYFSKHEYWIIQHVLIPILNTKTGAIKDKLFKGDNE